MSTLLEIKKALREAHSSKREIDKKVGPDGCVTLRLRGPEGKPAWILGAKINANFQGSAEEAAKFKEELSKTLRNIKNQVLIQNML